MHFIWCKGEVQHAFYSQNQIRWLDVLAVEKQYKLGLQGCDCVQNISYSSQTEEQEKFASSQNLLTYLFNICLTMLSAAQAI